MRASRFVLVLVVSATVVVSGCRRNDETIEEALAPIPSAIPAPAALDQLRPGELAEGKEKMFGLVVPRDLRIVRRFSESIVATGAPRAEEVANYVRHRVTAATVEVGPARTIFNSARIKGDEREDKLLRIEVVQYPSKTELVVKDVTPIPIDEGLTEEERWRRAGISPSGKQLNLREMQ